MATALYFLNLPADPPLAIWSILRQVIKLSESTDSISWTKGSTPLAVTQIPQFTLPVICFFCPIDMPLLCYATCFFELNPQYKGVILVFFRLSTDTNLYSLSSGMFSTFLLEIHFLFNISNIAVFSWNFCKVPTEWILMPYKANFRNLPENAPWPEIV